MNVRSGLIDSNSWILAFTVVVHTNGVLSGTVQQCITADRLYSSQNLGILIPRQQRILSTPRLRISNISPSLHEFLVAADESQFARNGAVQVLDDIEVSREEDVKVALVDL